ncbi:hypothetical protein SAMN02745941_04118 [Clostridium intestinale DSM 6191]|uniref:Uncharacterized protein n=2 Tax=Clostridium intestinale TaxID=36845 RepID=A0A1M6CTX1_9CLOT|nr:hypothetical protein SAMN02745941_04118 [Clostridium intestinale DSM 6191]
MDIKLLLFIFIPIVFFIMYMFLAHFKQGFEEDMKLTRRGYYVVVLIWISLFSISFYEKIKEFTIIEVSWSPQYRFNFIFFLAGICLLAVIWDFVFISCRTLINIKLKNTEFTLDEIKSVKYVEMLQENEIDTLYAVLNSKIKVLKYIDTRLENGLDVDINELYESVIKEYAKIRKQIKVYTYYDSEEDISRMQKDIKLTLESLSSIMYSINLFGFCKPQEFRKSKYIFAKLNTKYLNENIIFVLKGNLLIDKEHIIIIEVISYLEQKLEIEVLKMELFTSQHEE